MSRESFIADMERELHRPPSLSNGQPGLADLRAYFETLRGNPDGALRAYREYARSFLVHIETATSGGTIDVVWPGGSCDRWDELVARPRRQHRRVIDCEGYALVAHRLLEAAGWDFAGYIVLYLPTQTDPSDYHIVVVMEYPGDSGETVYIGSGNIHYSWSGEATSVWGGEGSNARSSGLATTADEAMESVQRQAGSAHSRVIAPLSGHRSFSPPPPTD